MIKEFTTKQLAELLEVSKPTVQKIIKELNITPERTDNRNRGFYSYEDSVSVIKRIKPNFDLSLVGEKPPNFAENTENPQNKPPNFAESTAKPQNEELELLRNMISIIQNQLEEKDKQLAVKDKQIADLSDRLAEALQLTKGQQYIAAADKTKDLLEADAGRRDEEERDLDYTAAAAGTNDTIGQVQPQEPLQKKKGFFARIFGF